MAGNSSERSKRHASNLISNLESPSTWNQHHPPHKAGACAFPMRIFQWKSVTILYPQNRQYPCLSNLKQTCNVENPRTQWIREYKVMSHAILPKHSHTNIFISVQSPDTYLHISTSWYLRSRTKTSITTHGKKKKDMKHAGFPECSRFSIPYQKTTDDRPISQSQSADPTSRCYSSILNPSGSTPRK